MNPRTLLYIILLLFPLSLHAQAPAYVKDEHDEFTYAENNIVYTSADSGKTWIKKTITDFSIYKIRKLNRDSIILWDGKYNHVYNPNNQIVSLYQPPHPLAEFLKYPIRSIQIYYTDVGCFHNTYNYYVYRDNGTGKLIPIVTQVDSATDTGPFVLMKGESISLDSVSLLLDQLNQSPYNTPTWDEFNITIKDITLARKGSNSKSTDFNNISKDNKLLARIVPNLDKYRKPVDVSDCSVSISFFNSAGEVLEFNHTSDGMLVGLWLLPWEVTYKSERFTYFHPDLSRLAARLMPGTEEAKKKLNNTRLLLLAAEIKSKRK